MLQNKLLIIVTLLIIVQFFEESQSKYLEGRLKTRENWAFLARFCFLSEDGQFDYTFEFDKSLGTPNLLLYYDTEDQWPAVYHTDKTCEEKENVLNIKNHQIINLTAEYPYNEQAGCLYRSKTGDWISGDQSPKSVTYNTTLRDIINNSAFGIKWEISYEHPISEAPIFINTTDNYENVTDDGYVNTTYLEDVLPEQTQTTNPLIKRSIFSNGDVVIRCRQARRFRSARERWWFIAISNCRSTKGIDVKYKLLMTNGPRGDYWHEHFSADEFLVLPVLMCYAVTYSFLMLAIIICSIELKARQLLHSTYKIFMFSVFLQYFGILIQSLALIKYATNGIGVPKVNTVGRVLMAFSETLYLLLLILLAKGFTTTRGRLPIAASVKITIFMCFYSLTYISLFIYEEKVFDPGEVLYIYESPAGYGLIVLRILAWCMFIYSTIFTLKHYPEKSNFYYPFNVCGTLWFISGPAFVLAANAYVDKWVRESIVCAVLLFIAFSGHVMFLILTLPSYANKNFPYHVRTTQIGVLNPITVVNNVDSFQHHPYEPSAEQSIIIPLSQRTEDLFSRPSAPMISIPNSPNITAASLFTIANVDNMQSVRNSMTTHDDDVPLSELERMFHVQTSKNLFTISDSLDNVQNSSSPTLSNHENNIVNQNGISENPNIANVLKWSQIKNI